MKKIMSLFLIFNIFVTNANAATKVELQDIADCMGAIAIINANFQQNGDHKNYKVGQNISARLMDLFYDNLSEYQKNSPAVDLAYLGQMPNRAIANYEHMNDLQQLKYAQNVIDVNKCFKYDRQK